MHEVAYIFFHLNGYRPEKSFNCKGYRSEGGGEIGPEMSDRNFFFFPLFLSESGVDS